MRELIPQIYRYLKKRGYFDIDWIDRAGWAVYLLFMLWAVL